jgi:hypothetical protein
MAFKTFPTKNLSNSNGGGGIFGTLIIIAGVLGLGYLFKTQVLDKKDTDDKK